MDAHWKLCAGYNKDILGILGEEIVFSMIHHSEYLFVWRVLRHQTFHFLMNIARSVNGRNSIDLGFFQKNLSHFNMEGKYLKPSSTIFCMMVLRNHYWRQFLERFPIIFWNKIMVFFPMFLEVLCRFTYMFLPCRIIETLLRFLRNRKLLNQL